MAQRVDPNAERMPEGMTLLDARVAIPRNVVYRSFPTETVALNLDTGRYHGLNVTAGRMLGALERSATVREAVTEIALQYDLEAATVERDLCELCDTLMERGLIELHVPALD